MSALRAAEKYVRAGFAVVPIPHRSKGPVLEGWESLRLITDELPEHFNGRPQNVGLILGQPSGGLVDVDQDAAEATRITGRFLPPTLTSGRQSRQHSHWWFISPGARTAKFKDVDGAVLVELRSTGCQTLVQPSTHPSGERIVWHDAGVKPAHVGAGVLFGQVRELATATLIARHLPPAGGRHDYALALSGFLLRPGRLDEEAVLKLLRAAWHAGGADSKEALRDLEGIVSDTAENLTAGEPVVGGPTLDEYAPGMVRLLCKWWGWNRHETPEEMPEEKEIAATRPIG